MAEPTKKERENRLARRLMVAVVHRAVLPLGLTCHRIASSVYCMANDVPFDYSGTELTALFGGGELLRVDPQPF